MMRVKEAVLTFVAMGGFAVPIVFSSSSSPEGEASPLAAEQTVPNGEPPLKPQADVSKKA